ncbi:MAG: hypothetical protein HC799_15395 [Limnothrix sp. RL_2_0]|nr:hypothetical protein [Limnothrix sp. RL_2_0]
MNCNYRREDFSQNSQKFRRISSENGFVGADLRGTKFDRLTINEADFTGALLHGASFREAKINRTIFDECQTGLTNVRKFSLILFSFVLSFLSGLNAAYTISILFVITNEISLALGLIFFAFLLVGIILFIIIVDYFEISILLYVYILLVILTSSTVTAFTDSSDIATSAILGFACLIVSLTSVWIAAQSSFITSEIERITESTSFIYKSLYQFSSLTILTISVSIGTYLADNDSLLVFPFICGCLLCSVGFFLGKKISRKYSSKRFFLLRQFFLKIFQNSLTSFKNSEFRDLSFKNSYISSSDFSPRKISGSLDISGSNLDDIDRNNLANSSNIFIDDGLNNCSEVEVENNSQSNVFIIDGGSSVNVSYEQVNHAPNNKYVEVSAEDIQGTNLTVGDNNTSEANFSGQ